MKIRAWLNDDPNSNEMKTYIIPEDCRMSWDFDDRVNSYEKERKKHVKQMENEVIGLALICRENGIYKDLFELLRDGYIFRPVEKEKKKDAKEEDINNYTRALKWCITFTMMLLGLSVFFIIFQIVLVEPTGLPLRSIENHLIGYSAGPFPPRSTENYLGVPGPPGPTGPPGICL
jgi:hypothetical protein